jgi:hypothetical protein
MDKIVSYTAEYGGRMVPSDDPITIALVVGGSLQAVSTIQQGRAAEAAGEFQAEIAARNADEARKQAEGQRQAAAEAAIEAERRGKAFKAKQRASFAKSGVELRGSPLSVSVETAQDIEADAAQIRKEGAIRASSLEVQAGIITAQGEAARLRGKSAKRASVLSAVGGGISTVGSVGKSRFDRGLKPFSPGRR